MIAADLRIKGYTYEEVVEIDMDNDADYLARVEVVYKDTVTVYGMFRYVTDGIEMAKMMAQKMLFEESCIIEVVHCDVVWYFEWVSK